MNKYLLSFLLLGVLVTACTNEDESEATGVQTNSAVPMSSIPSSAPADSAKATPNAIATQPAAAAGTNPPHGQPGHRCDIEVGAPLNSAPAAASPSVMQAPPKLTIPAAGSPAARQSGTSASGRLNPPHGQPGHSCAIPVGQPLN